MKDKNSQDLVLKLKKIVGERYVLTSERQTERFRKGYRSGEGEVLAVIRPANLLEKWQVLELCHQADVIVIFQAANTGLTEGSIPNGKYDRNVILINTLRIKGIYWLEEAKQVICLPGSTLYQLEKQLKSKNRLPHSVIGSSCIGASVVGGVCNNSGGSLVERGPCYTELSLFAEITADGQLRLVNQLGIDLGDSPKQILENLEKGNFKKTNLISTDKLASDREYQERVRDIKAQTPARFNADKRRLYSASGSAGKLAVFAVRLDTYPMNEKEEVFYIGTNDAKEFTRLRQFILKEFKTLPVSAEYLHRDAFNLAQKYGKDTVILIRWLGSSFIPKLFAIKGWIDALTRRVFFLPNFLTDWKMHLFSKIWPNVLPKRMLEFRDKFEHHLILKTKNEGIEEAEKHLSQFFSNSKGDFFICDDKEGKIAELHRFSTAGAAIRYHHIHHCEVEDILALDIALPRNSIDWKEELPESVKDKIMHTLYYGHFLCYVFHQDYIVKKGVNVEELKETLLALLDKKNAQYPAEHNVGHLYFAKKDLADFYQKIDPTNSFNPGIGKMSKQKNYAPES